MLDCPLGDVTYTMKGIPDDATKNTLRPLIAKGALVQATSEGTELTVSVWSSRGLDDIRTQLKDTLFQEAPHSITALQES